MGGGDLNSKKSWHPNTMKNQERVWKAEQAAAEEKKRISQLQSEHAQEKSREELNEMAKKCSASLSSSASDDRLHWMYNKPEKTVQQEDYLLGKEIEKSYDQPEKSDIIPAVARRVVGSSMLATAGDTQVDLARKIREDPLLLVKERERAARAALLNNPLHRRRIAELLKKEQMQKKLKEKNKAKKNLDNVLAEKLNALGGDKSLDLAALLASDSDDSSSSDSEKKSKKKKNKLKKEKSKKVKKSHKHSGSETDSLNYKRKKKKQTSLSQGADKKKNNIRNLEINKSKDRHHSTDIAYKDSREDYKNIQKRKSYNESTEDHNKRQRHSSSEREPHREIRRTSSDRYKRDERRRRNTPERSMRDELRQKNATERHNQYKRSGNVSKKVELSEEEKAARLAEMAAAGEEREQDRGRRVARQRQHDREQAPQGRPPPPPAAPALPHSLEARIHSNRHYIQRDTRHMNEHFARR